MTDTSYVKQLTARLTIAQQRRWCLVNNTADRLLASKCLRLVIIFSLPVYITVSSHRVTIGVPPASLVYPCSCSLYTDGTFSILMKASRVCVRLSLRCSLYTKDEVVIEKYLIAACIMLIFFFLTLWKRARLLVGLPLIACCY